MQILFDPSRNVKPAAPKSFAVGLAPARKAGPSGNAVSDADRAWAAYELNKDSRVYEVLVPGPAPIRGGAPARPDFDALAGEALAADRLEHGLI